MKVNKIKQNYHIRKPNDENFAIQKCKKCIFVKKNV